MDRVQGKVVIVTGGASGIGASSARLLRREGAAVAVVDRDGDAARAVAAELGDGAIAVELDVTDAAGWEGAVGAVEQALGPASGLVNSAGIASYAPIAQLDEREYRRIVDVNQVGTFLGMRAVLGSMERAGGGTIVNVSSLAGLVGLPMALAYTASKWAVRGMTKSAAAELGPQGIRVNSVHPGVIDTPLAAQQQGLIDQIIPQLPLGRIGVPDEIGSLVLFLISDESSYMTGTELAADGGWHVS